MPNRLAHERSPYLRQHADNPVDWYPWGEEALNKARAEDKPILLSIGYAACHWCHVMERESFQDPETAALMNERFVNIKVDREERPDLDSLYMEALQILTGQGGWPMTLFLTPDGRPFYGGTYFPPEPRYGMPSFRQVLEAVPEAYASRRGQVAEVAHRVTAVLGRGQAVGQDPRPLRQVMDEALTRIHGTYDAHHGGFGGAPKFPQAMVL
ncbi:MAG: thioredoxin domain-containing protein, partial [Anaerolineae bacterium]|nr:thioredoxin domain-containing protein [Anaerolineae bacterium]